MNAYIDFVPWFATESLRADGSNFIEWYRRLRALLQPSNVLYTIEEPLGAEPSNDANLDETVAFLTRRDYYILVHLAIVNAIVPELKSHYDDIDSNEIIDDLMNVRFWPQTLLMKHECFDEFLSCKMEEHTCVRTHLAKMDEIFHRLTVVFDYWTTDTFGISVIQRSLPPSYKSFVENYVMGGESVELPEFLEMVRNVQVEPIEGEIVDETGIFDIQML